MEPNDRVPLAELTQAVLDQTTLQALVADLTTLTTILGVTTKGGQQHHAKASQLSLMEAMEALQQGMLRGVQIHYLWQGQEWLDTLLRGPEGSIRIVRTAQA
jgi:hypothetical protein